MAVDALQLTSNIAVRHWNDNEDNPRKVFNLAPPESQLRGYDTLRAFDGLAKHLRIGWFSKRSSHNERAGLHGYTRGEVNRAGPGYFITVACNLHDFVCLMDPAEPPFSKIRSAFALAISVWI
jgi:hypothetical protein